MDTYSPEEAINKWGLKYVPLEDLKHWVENFNKQKGQNYPCSNQVVVCGIITKDVNKAINYMKNKNIIKTIKRRNEIIWYLDNNEKWVWKTWSESCRGYRFYKIAIDQLIKYNFFREFIIPKCGHYCCSFEII